VRLKTVACVGALLLGFTPQAPAQQRTPPPPAATQAASPAAAAPSAPSPVPEQTSQVFGDWTYRCLRLRPDQAELSCEVVSAVQAEAPGPQQITVQLAVGPSEVAGRTSLVVAVPANVTLTTPLRLVRDGAAIPDIAYDSCLAGYCRGFVDLDEASFQRLLEATADGRLVYRTSMRQDFTVPISFRGFRDAVSAMRAGARRN
jgi:invasion protein IalB